MVWCARGAKREPSLLPKVHFFITKLTSANKEFGLIYFFFTFLPFIEPYSIDKMFTRSYLSLDFVTFVGKVPISIDI